VLIVGRTRFSFLSAGPLFQLELPDEFDALPETSSPLSINDGTGHRSYVFVPAAHDAGMDEHRLLSTMADRDGRTVEFYEQLEPPPVWYLRWLLSNGALYTHLRAAEGPEWAPTIVANLAIVERDGLPPSLLPSPPLGRGVSARPGYQEEALFRSQRGLDWAVTLRRPGFVPRGTIMRDPDRSKVLLRGGACCETEITVLAGNDLEAGQELLSGVLNSLAEG
jgi:hypothetical protein